MPNTGPLPRGSRLRPPFLGGLPRCDVFVVCPRAGVRQDTAPFDDGVLCSPVPRLLILTVHQSGADAIGVGGIVVVVVAIGVDVPHVVGVVGVRGAEPPVGGGNELYPVVIQGGDPPCILIPRLHIAG